MHKHVVFIIFIKPRHIRIYNWEPCLLVTSEGKLGRFLFFPLPIGPRILFNLTPFQVLETPCYETIFLKTVTHIIWNLILSIGILLLRIVKARFVPPIYCLMCATKLKHIAYSDPYIGTFTNYQLMAPDLHHIHEKIKWARQIKRLKGIL